MNTTLLRLVRYPRRSSRNAWVWSVPGSGNPVVLHFEHSFWRVPAVTWPAKDRRDGSEIVRGARLDWHRSVVKNELRALIERCSRKA